jgi:hypothetical protein
MLKFKPSWVKPDIGRGDEKFQLYPNKPSRNGPKRGLWIE